jgi:MFS transporter, ACS family, hexuronate transporter
MPVPIPDLQSGARGSRWKWWVCGLLLLATMLNYMDRLTLNLTAHLIKTHFNLDEVGYAQLESAFAFAFALGAIIAGWMADRWNVRWLYPAAILGWSVAGLVTGLSHTFVQLLVCRFMLGLFEAGNWPCALRTTQRILRPSERTMGNSLLQSGAAFGAILTPLIIMNLVSDKDPDTWRYPFLVVGAVGFLWIWLWLPSVRQADLALAKSAAGPSLINVLGWLVLLIMGYFVAHLPAVSEVYPWLPQVVTVGVTVLGIGGVFLWLRNATRGDTALPRHDFFRRFWVLVVLVIAINTTWHYLRAWLPLFLHDQRGYSTEESAEFMLWYYVATDVGSLGSGLVVLTLARRGLTVFTSRAVVFLVCALLTLLSLAVAALPAGALLLGVLLVIGFAALGLFPVYYSFSQDLTVQHQGKVTGALGCINWLAMALLHELVGDSIKRTGNYSEGLALAGVVPLVGFLALLFLWRPARANPALGTAAR